MCSSNCKSILPTKNKYVIWISLGLSLHYIRSIRPEIYTTLNDDHPQTVRYVAKASFYATIAYGLIKGYQPRCNLGRPLPQQQANTTITNAATTAHDHTTTKGIEIANSGDSLPPSSNGSNQKNTKETNRESGVDREHLPRHVAVIMDGNRRYGRARYGQNNREGDKNQESSNEAINQGHKDGVKTLYNVVQWCSEEDIEFLTVYGFSTENWRRSPSEVHALMTLFAQSCIKYRHELVRKNVKICLMSTGLSMLPVRVRAALEGLQAATAHCTGGLQLNLCISYSGRDEIVCACRDIANQVASGDLSVDSINETTFRQSLLRPECPDPDVLIRTSGDYRLSNFLLWNLAYTELFFLDDVHWPEFQKQHLLKVIREYAECRKRNFGK